MTDKVIIPSERKRETNGEKGTVKSRKRNRQMDTSHTVYAQETLCDSLTEVPNLDMTSPDERDKWRVRHTLTRWVSWVDYSVSYLTRGQLSFIFFAPIMEISHMTQTTVLLSLDTYVYSHSSMFMNHIHTIAVTLSLAYVILKGLFKTGEKAVLHSPLCTSDDTQQWSPPREKADKNFFIARWVCKNIQYVFQ